MYERILIKIIERERGSTMHISQAYNDVLDPLVFFHVFAERAASLLHVSKLVFILHEELAAALAESNGHIWHHVLVELPWHVRAERRVINDEDLFIPHVLENPFVNFNSFVGIS
jgi:hypothetical protein